MDAYKYIRKKRGINNADSITELSYGLDIEEVIELMEGYKKLGKRYKFTFRDLETDVLIIVKEDTERKAFRAAFRTFETPKDRELRLISKELESF